MDTNQSGGSSNESVDCLEVLEKVDPEAVELYKAIVRDAASISGNVDQLMRQVDAQGMIDLQKMKEESQ
jgi:hypothetical protein